VSNWAPFGQQPHHQQQQQHQVLTYVQLARMEHEHEEKTWICCESENPIKPRQMARKS
jgi:hypothetical protein